MKSSDTLPEQITRVRAYVKSVCESFQDLENECVNDLLSNVPVGGGSLTREGFENLIRVAFSSGFTAAIHSINEARKETKANEN